MYHTPIAKCITIQIVKTFLFAATRFFRPRGFLWMIAPFIFIANLLGAR